MSKKPKLPKAPEAPKIVRDEVEVKFTQECIFKGKKIKKGDKIVVTKNVQKHLVSRKLIGA